jgi:methionine synthase II (cobalamin-independent)
MFAMLQGPWPRVTADGIDLAALEAAVAAGETEPEVLTAAIDRLASEVLAVQAEAGLELLSDGQVRWPDMADAVRHAIADGRLDADRPLLAAWTAAAAAAPTGSAVAQAVPGPYTMGRRQVDAQAAARADRTLGLADALAGEVEALVAAGCPVIVVEEPAVVDIGDDADERALFTQASQRLLARAGDAHTMLAITGGSAHRLGGPAIFEAPWRSVLVDLIAGPDNWQLVREVPGDRGVVCAALRAREDGLEIDQAPELVWAAQYAASSNGRGLTRVGLANATRLADRMPDAAAIAMRQLAQGAGFAVMPVGDAVEAGLDPRTIRDARPIPATSNRAARRRAAREAKEGTG